MKILRQTKFAALAVAVGMAVQGGARAEEPEQPVGKVNFHIEQQPIGAALTALGEQSGLTIIVESKLSRGLTTQSLSGSYTADEALKKILEPAGLQAEYLDSRTILIRSARSRTSANDSSINESRKDQALKVAQAETMRKVESTSASTQDINAKQSSTDDAERRSISEIVVTAQRREENLQDVPIAISVLGGEQLDSFTGGGVSDALNYLPGVALTEPANASQAPGTSFISMRGVSASGSNSSGASPTALYIDGVPYGLIKSAIFPNLNAYDLDRVEVLRGPHGSLYGASALNGVVRVFTHEPDLDEFGVKFRASISSIEGGGDIYRGDAAINVPIMPNQLAARLVIGRNTGGGWIDDVNSRNINDRDNTNIRLKVRAQPTDRLSVGLTGWYSRDDIGAPDVGLRNDFIPATSRAGDSSARVEYKVAGLEVSYDFPAFTATSMTTYLDYMNNSATDVTSLLLPTIFPPGRDDLFHIRFGSSIFTEELNLVSTGEGLWRWSAGAFYRDAEERERRTQIVLFPRGLDFAFTSRSYAVYGELTRLFFDDALELTGGLRYFEDRGQDRENANFDGVGPLIVRPEKTYTALSPRAVLTWHASDDAMFYASYGEGFRSGADQSPTVTSFNPDFPEYDPDSLTNYEIGSKGSLLDGGLRYEAAVYYIDWQDPQQGVTVPNPATPGRGGLAAIVNGDSASGIGYEVALAATPTEGLDLALTYSRSNLTTDTAIVHPNGTVLLAAGSRLSYSPEYTLGGSASYSWQLGGRFDARLSAQANFSPGVQAVSIRAGSSVVVTQAEETVTSRAEFAISSDSGWTAMLFADNLPNERIGGLRPNPTDPLWPLRQPRTIGVQFEYNY